MKMLLGIHLFIVTEIKPASEARFPESQCHKYAIIFFSVAG